METARKLDEHYTYADYCTWDDDQRWELIHGIPYAMAPAPSVGHQGVSFELAKQIGIGSIIFNSISQAIE